LYSQRLCPASGFVQTKTLSRQWFCPAKQIIPRFPPFKLFSCCHVENARDQPHLHRKKPWIITIQTTIQGLLQSRSRIRKVNRNKLNFYALYLFSNTSRADIIKAVEVVQSEEGYRCPFFFGN
jgi:hypothetical protein